MKRTTAAVSLLVLVASGFGIAHFADAHLRGSAREAGHVDDDLESLIARTDAHIRALSSRLREAVDEAHFRSVERHTLATWGEPHDSPELRRLDARRVELERRCERFVAEVDELTEIARGLRRARDARDSDVSAAERPEWIDRARVLLRVVELDATD